MLLGLSVPAFPCAQWGAGARDVDVAVHWWVMRAVENNDLSATGGEVLMEHMTTYGPPRAPEEALRIEGLLPEEVAWLLDSRKWHQLCRSPAPKAFSMRGAYTSMYRHGIQRVQTREIRLSTQGFRGRVHLEDTVTLSGSWGKVGPEWSYVVGDHALRWGQGLTIPRSDPFGLALFVGSSEARLSLPPSSAFHSDFQGGYRGIAVEKSGVKWGGGCSVGRAHRAMQIQRTYAHHVFSWTAFQDHQSLSWGVDWTGRRQHWDGQIAFARADNHTLFRSCVRTAQTESWVFQVGANVSQSDRNWESEIRSFATWISPQTGGQVQCRIRRRSADEWDFRAQGQTRRDHPLRWSVQSRMGERMVGCQYQAERLRVHVWAGQGPEGLWTHARHVEASWVGKSDGHWSAYVLDGQAPWGGAYVALPALDARQWSRAPDSGLQMGLRYRSSKNALSPSDWEWKGAWQFSWAPSQQETFRCAWRIRWEA